MNNPPPFLTIKNNKIVDNNNDGISLRGVNLGGWLMMEGYILCGRNISEKSFKRQMVKYYGKKRLEGFTLAFRDSFIKEDDFKNISALGMNCIRLPFNFGLLEEKNGIDFLEKALSWCEEYNIYCILDMHAAPGCQNSDWHADSDGESFLWGDIAYQKRFFKLWQFIADRFKDREIIAGYDVLNEPVIRKQPKKILRNFYKEAVKCIRQVDRKHIIFLEGNFWAQILEDIEEPFTDNLSYSIHYYHPLDFTFNFQRGLAYPGKIQGKDWNRERIKRDLESYYRFGKKWGIPIFVGEFGVNLRCEKCAGSVSWLKDILEIFDEFDFHWTYWTYKSIANSVFPDGIYQYLLNPPWVRREGPIYGWENFYSLWKGREEEIVRSWETQYFEKNRFLSDLLHKSVT
ncbi:MAG: glycoside hydrolase family 5 protein [Candidatus Omnitrophica bacterium]|nr:glycoside hydrolase family 5 protein [Candidatus Omnitrophota bacterium]